MMMMMMMKRLDGSGCHLQSGILIHPVVWPLEMIGHNRHLPKIGGCYAPLESGTASPSNTVWPAPRPIYLRTKWHLDPSNRLATTDMGRNLEGCPFGGWSPCNTMSPLQRSTSIPVGILIHLAVWPQQTWAEN